MTIAVSILFDASFIEPALLTAYEMIGREAFIHHVYLTYLLGNNEEDAESFAVLNSFCEKFNAKRSYFSAITLQDSTLSESFHNFGSHHFNKSIIYKLFIPKLIEHEKYIMNIDAGILPGDRFDAFLYDIDSRYCTSIPGDWIMAAHCHESEGRLPASLASLAHHRLYPAGGMLLFNSTQYARRNWYDRLSTNFLKFSPHLAYAEQELACLSAEEDELLEFPSAADRATPLLGLERLQGTAPPWPKSCDRDCLFFKIIGSVKPWKYWVLDPNKAVYTRRRAALETEFPLSGIALIEKHRTSVLPSQTDWPAAFARAYDTYLLESDAEPTPKR